MCNSRVEFRSSLFEKVFYGPHKETHLLFVLGGKLDEVLHRFWHRLAEQTNLNPSNWLATNGDVEKDLPTSTERRN